jgi:flagellar motor switch protein FliN/FliY
MTEEEIRYLLGAVHRGEVEIRKVQFPSLKPLVDMGSVKTNMDHLDDVYIDVSVELGRGELNIREMLSLDEGSIIKLDRIIGEAVDVNINGQRFAKGEVIVINDEFNVRISAVNQAKNSKLSEGLL